MCPGDGGGKSNGGLSGQVWEEWRGGSRHWVFWGPWEEVRSENEQKSSDIHYAAANEAVRGPVRRLQESETTSNTTFSRRRT